MTLYVVSIVLMVALNVVLVDGDIYLHNCKGSNNRLAEKSANRRDGNRMFDSQNNNKGGYNVGDKFDQPANGRYERQYQMFHFQSGPNAEKGEGVSHMRLEWTAQHGCGENKDTDQVKLNCNFVLQYMCHEDEDQTNAYGDVAKPNMDSIRDGVRQGRIGYREPPNQRSETETEFNNRKRSGNSQHGMNEPFEWYDKCVTRERNKGLFTADQNLNGRDKAKNTRQNPNGNRNGYECPEERDYYPYWHPSDWKDIAILASDTKNCATYQKESYNVKPKHECVETFRNSDVPKHYSKANNERDCQGTWTEFTSYLEILPGTSEAECKAEATKVGKTYGKDVTFARPIYGHEAECLVKLKEPECIQAPKSRVNQLGNAGADPLKTMNYDWKLPNFPSGTSQNCVVRIRYNISTMDYDPFKTDSRNNGNNSPVKQNPQVNVGVSSTLQLAINTAQTGRTFQDRCHVIQLVPRKGAIDDKPTMHNLNIRGKRGNIVQTYPAVEYDFVPNNLAATTDDLIHMQWTGSNTHNNANPAGDGQAGDDGEGKGGTDRNNCLSMLDGKKNFFVPMEHDQTLMAKSDIIWTPKYKNKKLSATDSGIMLASSGYYQCVHSKDCQGESLQSKTRKMDKLLNNAPASFQGMVFQVKKKGNYSIGCTRNNNFSNRSQKSTICVK